MGNLTIYTDSCRLRLSKYSSSTEAEQIALEAARYYLGFSGAEDACWLIECNSGDRQPFATVIAAERLQHPLMAPFGGRWIVLAAGPDVLVIDTLSGSARQFELQPHVMSIELTQEVLWVVGEICVLSFDACGKDHIFELRDIVVGWQADGRFLTLTLFDGATTTIEAK